MVMSPQLRKLGLATHVTVSVGWLGGVAAFFALSIAAIASDSVDLVRGSYLAMNLIGQFVIVPLSFAALATGVIQALGTPWGLFRYYWVVAKFALTVGATALLVLHQYLVVSLASGKVLGTTPGVFPSVGKVGIQLVGDAGFAMIVLIAITALSIYKPWGKIQTAQVQAIKIDGANRMPSGLKIFLAAMGILLLTFIAVHLSGKGLHH